jgi:hypothetical protein
MCAPSGASYGTHMEHRQPHETFTPSPRPPSGATYSSAFRPRTRRAALASLIAIVAGGCGADDATRVTDSTAPNEAQPGASDEGAGASRATFYAIATELYGADFSSSTSLVQLVSSLDVSEIDLGAAREYNGRATVGSIGGWLFVMDGEEPIVERFRVAPDGALTADGQLSFANYGMPYWSIDDWGNTMVSATKAYFTNPGDGALIVWNPTTLEIVREIALPVVASADLELQSAPAYLHGDRLFRLFSWANFDSFEFSRVPQQLAVYDTATDELVSLTEETRCPALYSVPFEDEAGNLYFSNHVWSPMETLVKGAPQSCSLRVLAGQMTFDPTWQLRYADFAQGREGAVLRYLGSGQGLADIFHAERTAITDVTDPSELGESSNWRLWSVDIQAGTGAPIGGLDYKPGGYNDVRVGGRSFILMPSADYARTTAYELAGGTAVQRFAIQGSSYHMVELSL